MANRTWGDPSNPRQTPTDNDIVAAELENGSGNFVWRFGVELRTYLEGWFATLAQLAGKEDAGTADAAVAAHDASATAHGSVEANFVAHDGAGGAAHADVVAGGADGFMTGADKTKLDGIATGAEANTQPNVGGGAEVGLAKSGVDLPLRTLVSGDASVSITQGAATLDIRSTGVGGGQDNTQPNLGGGVQLGAPKNGVELPLRTLDAAQFELVGDLAKVSDNVFVPALHAGAGGPVHALSTPSAHGFMSLTDKGKLDGLPSSAIPDTLGTDGEMLSFDGTIYTKIQPSTTDGYVLTYRTGAAIGQKAGWEAAPSGGAVDSVFGRTGVVVATADDYTAAQVTNAADVTVANTFVAGQIITDAATPIQYLDVAGDRVSAWAYDQGATFLGPTNAVGQVQELALRMLTGGGVTFGVPGIVTAPTTGQVVAQDYVLAEGQGVFEGIGGAARQVLNGGRTDQLAVGYSLVDATVEAGASFTALASVAAYRLTGASVTVEAVAANMTKVVYLDTSVTSISPGTGVTLRGAPPTTPGEALFFVLRDVGSSTTFLIWAPPE